MKKKLLFVFGTRPEAIKLAPLIKAFQEESDLFAVHVCVTAQHREMLDQVLTFFGITPDSDLDIMRRDQTLFDITASCLHGLETVLRDVRPDVVFVQGDTTTAFAGALAGFYKQIPVAHIEAGLRSNKKYSPFPEEINRTLVGHIANLHFAPTALAVRNLFNEGITKQVWNVGNTVIDALFLGLELLRQNDETLMYRDFPEIDFSKRILLITGHRRESFGKPFENMCEAFREIARTHHDVELVYPVHLNPNVREPVGRILQEINNIHCMEPRDYPHLIWLMQKSYLVLTDSGGIQEEAPSLGKPVLVMRDVTERIEGIEAGTAMLVGTDKERIIEETNRLLTDTEAYTRMAGAVNPYGDGTTCGQIVQIMKSGCV